MNRRPASQQVRWSFATLGGLGELHAERHLTEDEFTAKAELLSALGTHPALTRARAVHWHARSYRRSSRRAARPMRAEAGPSPPAQLECLLAEDPVGGCSPGRDGAGQTAIPGLRSIAHRLGRPCRAPPFDIGSRREPPEVLSSISPCAGHTDQPGAWMQLAQQAHWWLQRGDGRSLDWRRRLPASRLLPGCALDDAGVMDQPSIGAIEPAHQAGYRSRR